MGGTLAAVIFDNVLRHDTTGNYWLKAFRKGNHFSSIEHILPRDFSDPILETEPVLYICIDDGIEVRMPSTWRPAIWHVSDTHLQYAWDLEKARDFDVVFAAQKQGCERLKEDGIENVFWLPMACDPDIHTPYEKTKRYDLCFIGNLVGEDRRAYLSYLYHSYPNIYFGMAFGEAMALIYSQSRIVFNCSVRGDLNMRVFEAMACGAFLITDRAKDNGLDLLFKDGEDLVTYDNPKELKEKVDFYLEHPDKREEIADNGRRKVLAAHTYGDRVETMLEKTREIVPW